MRVLFFLFYSVIVLSACKENKGNINPVISEGSIRLHISMLASDAFQGRKPFTAGEEKTLAYLQDEIQKIGLEPGNGNSYFQDVPLVEITGHPSATMDLEGPNNIVLKLREQYVAHTQRTEKSIHVDSSELIFCGYGIVAPEYNWNDYEGLDMKGKTALILVNDPGLGSEDNTFFKGNTMTYYGRWTYKYEEAARQGATAVMIIHETTMAAYPWTVVQASGLGGKLNLETLGYTPCEMQGWISLDAAKEIFKTAGLDLQKAMHAARKPGFKAIPLPYKVNASIENDIRTDISKNVMAVIPGNENPDEYIIITSHWDHLGIGAKIEGDSIYNGAVDNASGASSLLAMAEALSISGPNKRTIVFLWVTAEEQGLLGSAYYAAHPIFPPSNTVANLNMDAVYAYGPLKDLTVYGLGQSELDDYAQRWAEQQGRYILADPEPEKGYFFRSDNFNFAKIGIPALYAKGTSDHFEKGKEYAIGQLADYYSNRYHQPSDEYNESFDVGGIVLDAQLYLNVARELANTNDWPNWKEGSEFKAIRKR